MAKGQMGVAGPALRRSAGAAGALHCGTGVADHDMGLEACTRVLIFHSTFRTEETIKVNANNAMQTLQTIYISMQ